MTLLLPLNNNVIGLVGVISSYVHQYACNNLKMAGWIFITFVMDAMTFKPNFTLQFSTIGNMYKTDEVGQR
jgi:hypothetical protein